MQLNIYLISHPIIKILSKNIINNQSNEIIKTNNYKQIGLFLIYENIRKYLKIYNIYIKKFNKTQEITLLDNNIKYYILTDISNTYKMLVDIQLLLPNINIIDTTDDYNFLLKNGKINALINKNTRIIILEDTLREAHIIELIKYLNKDINIKQINIICIACYENNLNIIGKYYPELKIYTTKII